MYPDFSSFFNSDEGSDEVFGRRMEELMSRGVIPDSQKNLHLLPSGSTLPQASGFVVN